MIVARFHLRCDGCGCGSFGAGGTADSRTMLRRAARRAGWRRVGGEDLCGRCVSRTADS